MKKHLKKYLKKKSVLEVTENEIEEEKKNNPRAKEWNGNKIDEEYLRNKKKRERQKSYWEKISKEFKPKIDAKKQAEVEVRKYNFSDISPGRRHFKRVSLDEAAASKVLPPI